MIPAPSTPANDGHTAHSPATDPAPSPADNSANIR